MVRLLHLIDAYTVFALARSFNPTMVRLLLLSGSGIQLQQDEFQSHNGAIAAIGSYPTHQPVSAVSIPQWCDCCPER